MFKELLDEAKGDILSQVKENIDQIYADFESVAIDDEESSSCTVASDPGIILFSCPNSPLLQRPVRVTMAHFRIWQQNSLLQNNFLLPLPLGWLTLLIVYSKINCLKRSLPKYKQSIHDQRIVPILFLPKSINKFGSK